MRHLLTAIFALSLCAALHGQTTTSGSTADVACAGGQTAPCASTDRTVVPANTAPSGNTDGTWTDNGPPINQPWVNPEGHREVRATDGNIPGGILGGNGWQGPNTWYDAYWSPYDSAIGGYWFGIPQDSANTQRFYQLNPTTMSVTPVCPSGWTNCAPPHLSGNSKANASAWSKATPGLYYYFTGTQVCSWNYDTNSGNGTCTDGAGTLIVDFSNTSNCPAIPSGGSIQDLTVSSDDKVFGVWYSNTVLAVWNLRPTTPKCYWAQVTTNEVGGTDNPTPVSGTMSSWPSGIGFHDAMIGPSGSFAWMVPNNGGPQNWFWPVFDSGNNELTTQANCTAAGGSCLGHISIGYNNAIFVQNNNAVGTPFTGGMPPRYNLASVPMVAPTTYTNLISKGPPWWNIWESSQPFATPLCNADDSHTSWFQDLPGDNAPVLASFFRDTDGSGTQLSGVPLMRVTCPFDHEIVLYSTDGSGRVWKLAQNMASGLNNALASPQSSYNALSMPVCTPDGKYCLWVTDWANTSLDGQLGTQTGEISGGNYCQGTYGCAWHASTTYASAQEIIDSNGNEEKVTSGGGSSSGSSAPTWNTTIGGTTSDGGLTWTMGAGCNTPATTSTHGNCRTDAFIVEAVAQQNNEAGATLYGPNSVPATVNNSSSGNPVTLGVRFYSDLDGLITGVKFYKGSSDTGTHTGGLWDNSCTLLASGTFTGETTAGWQTLTFSSPVHVSADQIYNAGYYSPTGYYSDTSGTQTGTGMASYASSQWDSGVLHGLKNGSAPFGNSPYLYQTGMACPAPVYSGAGANLFGDNYAVTPVFVAGRHGSSQPIPLPNITSISPGSGSTSGGNAVMVGGTNFAPSIAGSTGGGNATIAWVSPISITLTPPAGNAGPSSVFLTNPNQVQQEFRNEYAYNATAPTVLNVAPPSGTPSGGTSVVVTGTGFVSPATVDFGANAATGVSVVNSTTIDCTTPSGTGTVNVSVTDANGMGIGTNLYTYSSSGPAPTISAAVTDPGAANASATSVNVLPDGASAMPTLYLTGTNFLSGMTVTIGGNPPAGGGSNMPQTSCTGVTIVSSTSANCTLPTASSYAETHQNIVATTTNGSYTMANGLFYGKILFQDNFASGNFSNWDQTFTNSGSNTPGAGFGVANSSGTLQTGATFAGSAVNSPPVSANFVAGGTCPSAPAIPAGGTYDVCQIYARAGSGNGDSDTYMAEYFSPGLQHYFVRWYVYFQTPTVGSQGYERKVLYTNAGKGLGFSDIPIAWAPSSGTNPGQWGFTYDNTSEGGSVPANTCYDGILPAFNTWYEIEDETQTNSTSPLTQNGYGNQWINGSFACSKSNTWLNGTSTAGSQYFNFGQQISATFTGAVTEYRFIADPVIADSYIP